MKSNLSAGLAAALCSGCSFIFVHGAPPAAQEPLSLEEPVRCTSSKASPAIDTVVTGLELVRVAVAASLKESDYQNAPIDRKTDIAAGAALATIFAASAVYGFTATSTCAEVKARREDQARALELQRRQAQYGIAPYRYPPSYATPYPPPGYPPPGYGPAYAPQPAMQLAPAPTYPSAAPSSAPVDSQLPAAPADAGTTRAPSP